MVLRTGFPEIRVQGSGHQNILTISVYMFLVVLILVSVGKFFKIS